MIMCEGIEDFIHQINYKDVDAKGDIYIAGIPLNYNNTFIIAYDL